MSNKIECLSVCVDFSDFLEISLPINKQFFDYLLIVTSTEDKQTKQICVKNKIDYIETNLFYKNNAIFNKGLALSSGFKYLKHKDWVVLMDCDCVLPFNFRQKFPIEKLNQELLYGTGRRFCWTYKDWLDLQRWEKNIDEFEYIPGYGCGFWELFNMNSKVAKLYPLDKLYPEGNVESDIIFLKRWCPLVEHDKNLGRIDMDVIHLGGHGIAHNSRKFSRIEEFKKPFKEQKNLSDDLIYK